MGRAIDVAWGAIVASALLLFWPVLGLPPWRSEASWIDRLGRAVGWGWIVAIASAIVLIGLESVESLEQERWRHRS